MRPQGPVRASTAPADPLVTVALIAEAKRKGLTWAQIAPTIGEPSAKAAKARAKRLARAANRQLLAQDAADRA